MSDVVQSGVDFFTGFAGWNGLGKPDRIIMADEPISITIGVACEWDKDGEPIRIGLSVPEVKDCRKIYKRLHEWPTK